MADVYASADLYDRYQIYYVFEIASQLLPLLTGRLKDENDCQGVTELLYKMTNFDTIILRDSERIIASSGNIQISQSNCKRYPSVSTKLETGGKYIYSLEFYKLPGSIITGDEKALVCGIGNLISTCLKYNFTSLKPGIKGKSEKECAVPHPSPNTTDLMAVWENDRMVVLSPGEIVYCRSLGDKTAVNTIKGTYMTPLTLANIEMKYERCHFLRTHKGYIVNPKYISEIVPWFNRTFLLVMKHYEKDEVPVSRTHMKKFKGIFGID